MNSDADDTGRCDARDFPASRDAARDFPAGCDDERDFPASSSARVSVVSLLNNPRSTSPVTGNSINKIHFNIHRKYVQQDHQALLEAKYCPRVATLGLHPVARNLLFISRPAEGMRLS